MRQKFLYLKSVNIRNRPPKFSRPGYMTPGICVPLVWDTLSRGALLATGSTVTVDHR